MARKPKKYHYIYKTTCKVTNKFYVGMHSTDNMEDGYLGSGKILGYSRKKYGDENHVREILEHCSSRDELKQREKEIVSEELLADLLNINLKYGGEGGWENLNDGSDSHRQRASKAGTAGNKSEKRDHLAIGKLAALTKARRGTQFIPNPNNFTGRKHTEETLQKMRQSHTATRERKRLEALSKR